MRLWVTSSWYLRWRWTARNLSKLRATIPRNEAFASANWITHNILGKVLKKIFKFTMKKGWAIKPTATSETARLDSNVFRGFGKEGVFLMAWIVKLLKTIAVNAVKAFTTIMMYFEVDRASTFAIMNNNYLNLIVYVKKLYGKLSPRQF